MTGAPAAVSMRNAAIFTAVVAAAVTIAALPTYWVRGASGLEPLAWAAAVCLIPGWLVFAFQGQYGTAAPLAAVLVGVFGRMAFVLSGALAVKAARPGLGTTAFALWLAAFYVLTLTLETKLLLTPPPRGPSDDPQR